MEPKTSESWSGGAYDTSTYWGRVMNFQSKMNPKYLFVTNTQIKDAQVKLAHAKTVPQSQCKYSTESVEEAQGVVDATVHPQTHQPYPFLGRMAAYVPVNIPICSGMILAAPTVPNLIFWQWINQSYNALFNLSHANKSVTESKQSETEMSFSQKMSSMMDEYQDVWSGYMCATVVSVGIAVGTSEWLKRGNLSRLMRKRLQSIVPYSAVVSAGVANVVLMRMKELSEGIPVYFKKGDESPVCLGTSQIAAKQAIIETAISRMALPIPILALPPVVLSYLNTFSIMRSSALMKIMVEVAVVSAGIWAGLPLAVAIFAQQSSMGVNHLEKSLQDKVFSINESCEEKEKITHVEYNKGV